MVANGGSGFRQETNLTTCNLARLNMFLHDGELKIRHRARGLAAGAGPLGRRALRSHRLQPALPKPRRTLFWPSTLANFRISDPEPRAGSYTLLTVALPTTVRRASNSDTSCGV